MNKRKQRVQEIATEETGGEISTENKLRIYLAAKYCEHERNNQLYEKLQKAGLDIFLPEKMNLDESNDPINKKIVFHRCYKELLSSDIVVAVHPFGYSVSAEIGYAIANNKLLICYYTENGNIKSECMIDPGFAYEVRSEEELVQLLKKLV